MANGSTSLIKNLDKYAYGGAGVLAVLILLVPAFSGGDLGESMASVQQSQIALESKSERFPTSQVGDPKGTIQKQWAVLMGSDLPAWTTDRRPAFVQFVKVADVEPLAHEAPSIDRIEYHRDADRLQTYLKISASFGAINLPDKGEIDVVNLLRRDGEGEFAKVKGFDGPAATVAGAVEFDDFDVDAGKTYTYKIETTLGIKPEATDCTLDSDAPNPQSHELGCTSSVPYDYFVNIIVASSFDARTGKEAHFIGSVSHADFGDGGEVVNLGQNKTYQEGFEFGPKWGEKNKSLWIIRPIEDGKLIVTNTKQRRKDPITSRDRDRSIELPEVTERPAPAPAESEDDVGDEDAADADDAPGGVAPKPEEESPPATPKPTTKKKKKKRGGLFK